MRLNMPTKAQRYDHFSPKGIYKGTREEWLEDAALIMADWINYFITPQDLKNHKLNYIGNYTLTRFKPSENKYRCGLTSTRSDYRMRAKAIGQIHYKESTGNGKNEIVISNRLNGQGKKTESCKIAHVLLHEMIHASTYAHGHKGEFKRLARSLQMDGKLTATTNSENLEERIKENIVDVLGKFPHKAVVFKPAKKGSRLLKITCTECNIVMRASSKVCDRLYGSPCPACYFDDYEHEQGQLQVEGWH